MKPRGNSGERQKAERSRQADQEVEGGGRVWRKEEERKEERHRERGEEWVWGVFIPGCFGIWGTGTPRGEERKVGSPGARGSQKEGTEELREEEPGDWEGDPRRLSRGWRVPLA